jgi:hypothetical protein
MNWRNQHLQGLALHLEGVVHLEGVASQSLIPLKKLLPSGWDMAWGECQQPFERGGELRHLRHRRRSGQGAVSS